MTSARIRFLWAVFSYIVVQSLLLGVAVTPAALLHAWATPYLPAAVWQRIVVLAVGTLPIYLLSALTLVVVTPVATRLLGWRTPTGEVMPIAEYGWPVLNWARRAMCTQAVRILVGEPLRGTPLWGLFVRLNGAHVGRNVWINSVAINDHDMLSFGDGSVIGHGVHLSGHTVEDGCVKTGTVHVGRGVTIGVGAVIGIDVEIGDGCRVGALSFVPKHARLESHATYVGIPVHRVGTADETNA